MCRWAPLSLSLRRGACWSAAPPSGHGAAVRRLGPGGERSVPGGGSLGFPRGWFSSKLGTPGANPSPAGTPSLSGGHWDLNVLLSLGGTEGKPGPDPGRDPSWDFPGSTLPFIHKFPVHLQLAQPFFEIRRNTRTRKGLGFSQAREAFPLPATLSPCHSLPAPHPHPPIVCPPVSG